MPTMQLIAIISITSALVFYTFGVWMEHFAKRLKARHLVLFILGLIFDTLGTAMMSRLADSSDMVTTGFNWHALTGGLALGLMGVHALWAAYVLLKKDENAQKYFHKFSLLVWLIWLIPYASGAFFAMK